MSFAEPQRLWWLVGPGLAAVAVVFRHLARLRQQRALASPAVWRRLMGGAPATGLVRLLAWTAAAALAVLALARPQWGELPSEESIRTRDLVVALDVSDSMRCPDLGPSRLARALAVLQRSLPLLDGNRVGVVVFSGDAYPLVPLTTDLHAVAAFLSAVEPGMVALPGSNIERALRAALELLPEEGEGRVVVLISDGENLQGDLDLATAAVRKAGAGMLALLAGTPDGGPIPIHSPGGKVRYKRDAGGQPVVTRARPKVMAGLAGAADGELLELGSRDAPRRLAEAVARLRTRELEATREVRRVERFQWFVLASALLVTIGFLLSPWRRMIAAATLLVLALSLEARAQSPPAPPTPAAAEQAPSEVVPPAPAWWQRLIPGGSRRLARSGLARWKAGKIEQAGRAFAGAAALDPDDADRLYDLGTALAASGHVERANAVLARADKRGARSAAFNAGTGALIGHQAEPAVSWLRRALLRNPDDPATKRNYELALRLLEEQKQQQQQQQEQQQQEKGEQPTPTPSPSAGPQPTPTPDPSNAVYAALERADAEARRSMQTPTPRAAKVEKDW